ncbi:MAG: fumarylacetoacetate hydrolase family protein [Pseudoclavibacter sp.]
MRLANHDGRAVILTGDTTGFDVETASDGAFGPNVPTLYEGWESFRAWANTVDAPPPEATVAIDGALLGAPSPAPRQIFAIGLNYAEHADESGFERPKNLPPVFTKWQSSLSGPYTTVVLPKDGNTDWEVELVAVVGATARGLEDGDGWGVVAGLTIGQDLSERVVQLRGPAPQFGLGKSFPGFSPTGPWLTTPDELSTPDDLGLWAQIGDEYVQQSRTGQLIFSVPQLVEHLSRIVTLHPGDIIFTGTPNGVGVAREPQRFLRPGETLTSGVEGLGTIVQNFIAS